MWNKKHNELHSISRGWLLSTAGWGHDGKAALFSSLSLFSLLFYELLPNAPKTHLQSHLHGSWSHYLDKWHHLLIFSRPSKAHISSSAPFFCLHCSSSFPSRRPGIFRAVWRGENIEHFFSHLSILIPEWWLKCARPRNDCLSSPAGMSHQSPHYRLKQHNSSPTCLRSTHAAPGGVYLCDCCVVVYAGCIMLEIKSTSFVPLSKHRWAKWCIMHISLFHPCISWWPGLLYLFTSLSQKRTCFYRITDIHTLL